MTKVIHETRTIRAAMFNQPFVRSEKTFRFAFLAMLYVIFIELMGPGYDYERAEIADA